VIRRLWEIFGLAGRIGALIAANKSEPSRVDPEDDTVVIGGVRVPKRKSPGK
jgi:hypothetical protein